MKPNRNLPYRDRVRNEPTTNSKTTRPAGYLPRHLSVSFSVPPFSLAASPLYLRKSSTFPSASQYKAAFIVNNAGLFILSVFGVFCDAVHAQAVFEFFSEVLAGFVGQFETGAPAAGQRSAAGEFISAGFANRGRAHFRANNAENVF